MSDLPSLNDNHQRPDASSNQPPEEVRRLEEQALHVMTAHAMVSLSREGRQNPAVPKEQWDAYGAQSAGVTVDDHQKFAIWLEGTKKFFRLLPDDRDCQPWLGDAYRVARRLDPVNAPRPGLDKPLDKHQATVELEALRTWSAQISRAAHQPQPPEHHGNENDPAPHEPVDPQRRPPLTAGSGPAPKEPTDDARIIYLYWLATGKTQTELANDPELMRRLGRKVDQGTISRKLRQMRECLKACGVRPELSKPLSSKPTPIDPERLDLGPHGEHRPKHRRKRRTSDRDD